MVSSAELLERRALLTLTVNFDFEVIASDLSTDLRLFGSNDPADAPLEVIRYASGSITTVEGFPAGDLLGPGDLTFEFGSNDVDNLVEGMRLDRDSFDDGATDGIANQNYLPTGDARIDFFHHGSFFAHAAFSELSLEVTPEGVTTGTGQFGFLLDVSSTTNRDNDAVRRLLNDTFRINADGDPNRGREFSLAPFNFDGEWAGVGDAEVFGSAAAMTSSDDLPDVDRFGVEWDMTAPYSGTVDRNTSSDHDNDWLTVNLDPNQSHTFRINVTKEGNGLVDFTGDFFKPSAHRNFDGRLLAQGFTTLVTVSPRSPTTHINIRADSDYTIRHESSQPDSMTLYLVDDYMLGWSPALDAEGNVQPADGYRVEVNSHHFSIVDTVFHTADVDASTFRYSLEDHLGVLDQTVRIGRIVDGEVVEWSEELFLSRVDVRPRFTNFDGNTLTWDAVPGARSYILVLNDNDHRAGSSINSYTLPDDHPIGWRRAWVQTNFRGSWSFPINYHARSAVQNVTAAFDSSNVPTISWDELGGAASYELFMRNKSTGETVLHETGLGGTSFTMADSLDIGTYDVWMRAISDVGVAARWSSPARISVQPEPESVTGDASELTFNWTVPDGIVSTDIYIHNAGVVVQRNVTGTSWTETAEFANGNVTWWVRGVDGAGAKTSWSDSQSVRIGSTVITNPTAGKYSFRATFSIAWLPVLGAESYEVLIRSLTEGDIVHETGLTSTSLPNFAPAGGRYTVWVKTNSVGGTGSYSRPVVLDVTTLHVPVLITPSGPVNSSTPTIQWINASNGGSTLLWFRKLEDNSNVQFRAFGTSFTVPTPLAAGTYRIWARTNISSIWSVPIVIIVSEVETPAEEAEPETLLALLELSPLRKSDSAATNTSASEIPPPDRAADASDPDTSTAERQLTEDHQEVPALPTESVDQLMPREYVAVTSW